MKPEHSLHGFPKMRNMDLQFIAQGNALMEYCLNLSQECINYYYYYYYPVPFCQCHTHSCRNTNTNGKYPVLTFCASSKATLKMLKMLECQEEMGGAEPWSFPCAHLWCHTAPEEVPALLGQGMAAETQGHRDAGGHLSQLLWEPHGAHWKGFQTGNALGWSSMPDQTSNKQSRPHFMSVNTKL